MMREPKMRPWTDEEVQQLRELAAAGTPTNVMTRKLRRSANGVRGKMKNEGIPRAGTKDE